MLHCRHPEKKFPDDRVYRIGGDEFVVLSQKLSKRRVELAVGKVRRDLVRDNYEISVGIETGACGKDVEKIVAAAELAMRNDKAAYNTRDTNRHIYTPDYFSELLKEADACFSAAVRLYVERFVKSEYYDRFDNILDYDKLDNKLSENKSVQFTYQKTDGIRMNVRILEVDRRQNAKSETIWIFSEENH